MTSPVIFYVLLGVLLISGLVFLLQAAAMAGKNKTGYAVIYMVLSIFLIFTTVVIGVKGIDTAEEIEQEQTEQLCEGLGGFFFDEICHNLKEAPKIPLP